MLRVEAFRRDVGLEGPFIGVHVRHGHKVDVPSQSLWRQHIEAHPIRFRDYLSEIRRLSNVVKSKLVLLVTEDNSCSPTPRMR
jgi:hypothetical protein